MRPTVEQFLWRVANVAIGSTTLRNQGASGVNQAAREFLANLALPALVCDTEANFQEELERQTLALRTSLPPNAQHWGTARKGLNVFLGEVYYHRVLCEEFGMDKVAEFLEVPLDNDVSRFLTAPNITPKNVAFRSPFWVMLAALKSKAAAAGRSLPRWTTIKGLSPEASHQFQEFAREYAKSRGEGWIRLHVDLVAWRSRQEQ